MKAFLSFLLSFFLFFSPLAHAEFIRPGSLGGSGFISTGESEGNNWVLNPPTAWLTMQGYGAASTCTNVVADIAAGRTWCTSNGSITQMGDGVKFTPTDTTISYLQKTFAAGTLSGITSLTFEFDPAVMQRLQSNGVTFRFFVDNSNYYTYSVSPTASTSYLSNGINRVTIPVSRILADSGSPTWAGVVAMQMRIDSDNSEDVPWITLRKIDINQTNRPIAVIELDDLYAEDTTVIEPIMAARTQGGGGKPVATMGIVTGTLTDPVTAGYMTYAQFASRVNSSGWDLTGQSDASGSAYGSMSAADIRTSVTNQLTKIQAALGVSTTPNSMRRAWTYNTGSSSTTARSVLHDEYGTQHAAGDTSESPIGFQSHESQNYLTIRGWSMSADTPPYAGSTLETFVTNGNTDGALMFFLVHSAGASAVNTTMYAALLDDLIAKNVQIMTRTQYINGLRFRRQIVTDTAARLVTDTGKVLIWK